MTREWRGNGHECLVAVRRPHLIEDADSELDSD